MADNAKKIENFITYQGKPLVRNGNSMVYGSFSEAAYADMIILTEDKKTGADGKEYSLPVMIMVTINSTDKSVTTPLRPQEFKQGLYEALDYSYTQIERFNKK